MEVQTKTIKVRLPGLSEVEYVYCEELKELTINIEDVEIKSYSGLEALQIFSQITEKRKINDFNELLVSLDRRVLKVFKKSLIELKTKSRKQKEYVLPRMIVYYWSCEHSLISKLQISKIFDQDNATVHHALKTIRNELTYNKYIKDIYDSFCNA